MYKDETRTANSLRMHYIAVRVDYYVVHSGAICSLHHQSLGHSACWCLAPDSFKTSSTIQLI